MSSFRKSLSVMVCLVLLIGTSSVMAQRTELYNTWSPEAQTINQPAGTSHQPGSQLLYVTTTGANLRAAAGADLAGYNASMAVVDQGDALVNPYGVGGASSIYNDDATVDRSKVNQNYITITNAHPTQAVTVHFRYFNDNCIDVLDFLVLLTCNDTLIFDPFNFQIPGTDFNTGTRIFGPAVGLFGPIRAEDFASGRFLIFATAAGTSYEPANVGAHDDNAELRFPSEFVSIVGDADHCPNLVDSTFFGLNDGLRADNLHVFNSSAVAFNYLIGNSTTSLPSTDAGTATHGVTALVRPAVDLTHDSLEEWSIRGGADGDGPPLVGSQAAGGNDFRILTGQETVLAANGASAITVNLLYLAQRAHGGDTVSFVNDVNGDASNDYDSWYGAVAMTSIFGIDFAQQAMHFISIVDDYNGSRHSTDAPVAGFVDRSYNLNGAETTYVLQIYDNDERLFDVREGTPINISPPPFEAPTAILKITVDCLRVWIGDIKIDSLSVDDLQISELSAIHADLIPFLNTSGITDSVQDASRGWIRFVRDNSIIRSDGLSRLYGTRVDSDAIHDSAGNASFVTQAIQTVTAGGRGASWWMFLAPSDPLVSTTGDPQCNGACDTKNNLN